MFKDFGRRLQRDLKKIVDARVLANNARTGGEITVKTLNDHFFFKVQENRSDITISSSIVLLCITTVSACGG